MTLPTELLQDIKALSGLPIFAVLIVLTFLLGEINLSGQLLLGLAFACTLTVIIRIVYFRERPDKQKYKSFLQKIDASSFPSLHAMRAAVLATILAVYFANILLTVIFILCAIGVATSRLLLKRHHFSDVFVGLVLGVILALISIKII